MIALVMLDFPVEFPASEWQMNAAVLLIESRHSGKDTKIKMNDYMAKGKIV